MKYIGCSQLVGSRLRMCGGLDDVQIKERDSLTTLITNAAAQMTWWEVLNDAGFIFVIYMKFLI